MLALASRADPRTPFRQAASQPPASIQTLRVAARFSIVGLGLQAVLLRGHDVLEGG
jgi:hypothetical protein